MLILRIGPRCAFNQSKRRHFPDLLKSLWTLTAEIRHLLRFWGPRTLFVSYLSFQFFSELWASGQLPFLPSCTSSCHWLTGVGWFCFFGDFGWVLFTGCRLSVNRHKLNFRVKWNTYRVAKVLLECSHETWTRLALVMATWNQDNSVMAVRSLIYHSKSFSEAPEVFLKYY